MFGSPHGAGPVGLRARLPLAKPDWRGWVPVWSPAAAARAARAAVVICGLFAFAFEVIGNLQVATFAAFGGFATMLFAQFGGTRREKLIAHLLLALTGSVLIVIGTSVSSDALLAGLVSLPVGFAVFFAGAASPNAARGATAALLAYILPAASAGSIGVVPSRLAGWWMASIVGTAAVLMFSPREADDEFRALAADLARSIADELRAALRGAPSPKEMQAVLEDKHRLMAAVSARPYRPTGLTAADQGLAKVIELLEWCALVVADGLRADPQLRGALSRDRPLLAADADVLADTAGLLAGADVRPQFGRLESERTANTARLDEAIADTQPKAGATTGFVAHTVAAAVRELAEDALIASRRAEKELIAAQRPRWAGAAGEQPERPPRLQGLLGFAGAVARHASVRSVWFLNSVRGAVALAVAVTIANLTGVQHAFWVVLGTLSVLRSNAAATGSTALRALLGTVLGFVLGAALILAIGTSKEALWAVLPVAVLIGAYTPGTAPFAVGQAAFTVVILVLFNLLMPVGWRVGLVRIEDVALGCGVSVVVGLLFWPRGASVVVANDLADGFRAGARFLTQAVSWALGRRHEVPDAEAAAVTAGIRLDDGLRGYTAEQGAKRMNREEIWRLVSASTWLRLTSESLAALPRSDAVDGPAAASLTRRASELSHRYLALAAAIGRPRRGAASSPAAAGLAVPAVLSDNAPSSESASEIWVREHLRLLESRVDELTGPALRIAETRAHPWWR